MTDKTENEKTPSVLQHAEGQPNHVLDAGSKRKSTRIKWPEVVAHAAKIVERYDTPVTLRQLFYQLVSDGTLPNTDTSYKGLSRHTAAAQRRGEFPALEDRGRKIEQSFYFEHAGEALDDTVRVFRLDRTVGQEFNIMLAVEKDGLVPQLRSWFGDRGLPVTALKGYSGQSHVQQVQRFVRRDGRPAVLLYAGDFDPTGEDIYRDFVKRTDCWAQSVQVALTAEQVDRFDLPPNPGKATDSRAKAFEDRHGKLVQVEVDALDPRDLRHLFEQAIAPMWDVSAHAEVLELETEQRDQLAEFAGRWAS